MWLKLLKNVQKWLREYHIRSHTESFHSSFKRVFGIITKIKAKSTYTQILARIILNNQRKTNYFNSI
jgi:transposase